MRRPLLYIIGPSGAGKTTLAAKIMEGIPGATEDQPIAHTIYNSGAIELGKRRGTFSGTDALSLGVNPKAIDFIIATTATAVLGEGDRLANHKFFTAAWLAGWDLRLVYLALPPEDASRRREQRGHPMRASFVKGRATKAANLAAEWAKDCTTLDARMSPSALVDALWDNPSTARHMAELRGKR